MTPPPKSVLLVEDNPDDELLTIRAFRKNNLHNDVVVARDGQEALDILFATGAHAGKPAFRPELVLLDLKLPRLDGLGVLRRIRGEKGTANLPVIVLTSSKQDEDILQSYELGANSYIRKPVDFERFLEAVQSLGLYWLILNEWPRQS